MRRRIHPPLVLVAALILGIATGTPPGAAQEDPPPDVSTRIVGGTQAGADDYPWNAAMIRRGADRINGFRCGATVLSRSWALTAAHCLLDYDGEYPDGIYGQFLGPSAYDVLTGTNSIGGSAGQRLQVVAVHPHPSYDSHDNDFDVALLRLGRPTSAPEIAVIGASAGALDAPGTEATITGWGVTVDGNHTPSTLLRYAKVPVQSSAVCSNSYPPGFTDSFGPLEYHEATMLCAGPISGGTDSCQGDSGGPLAVKAGDGTWRQAGVTSFGYGCARAGYPGVYHRLTSSSSWIGRTRRFGPFAPDATKYIQQQYRDFTGRLPSASELSTWKTKLSNAPPADLITSLHASPAWDANAGMNSRLYRAAFERNPDTSGFDYWIRRRWAGKGPVAIANTFVASSEFQRRYGSLGNDAFVTLIYQHVFHRNPDPSGRTYWLKKLNGGTGRGQVVYELSNSSEFRRATATVTRIVTTRFALLRTVPSATEITASEALSQRSLIDSLRTSYRYASRFTG